MLPDTCITFCYKVTLTISLSVKLPTCLKSIEMWTEYSPACAGDCLILEAVCRAVSPEQSTEHHQAMLEHYRSQLVTQSSA